jgi:hypothetical protein
MTTKYYADATTGASLGGHAPAPAYEVRTPQAPIIDPETGAEIPQPDLVETVTPEVVTPPNSVETPPPDHGDMIWNGSAWEWPEVALIAHLADFRFEYEVSGVNYDGMEIATDRESQSKVLAARVAATVDPTYSLMWKAKNGFFSLDAVAILAMSDAVGDHVRNAFTAEGIVAANIGAGPLTTKEQVEAAFLDAVANNK